MPEDEKGLYARAHAKIESLLPTLRGETLKRDDWYKLCNIHPTNPKLALHRKAINDVLWNLSQTNKKKQISKNGTGFKIVDDTLIPINFLGAGNAKFDIELPFGIHNYCFLYRKNIMIVYGSKEAGKTAFLLNVVRMNMHKHRILYFSSEMVEDEMANRLRMYEGLSLEDWNFEPFERSYDFHEVIDPDGTNLIDYLELGGETEYFAGVGMVRKIYDVLNRGIAIIACQKNKDAELPKGGSGLLEKARLAVSLDPGMAKITVAKNWCPDVRTSPRGTTWSYNLVGGVNYVNIRKA